MKRTEINKKVAQYTEIYNTMLPLVFRTVQTKVADLDEAGDICQEVFFRFYEKFEEVENHRKWLLGTTRYVVLEYYNRKTNKNVDINDFMQDINLTFVNGFKDTRIMIEEALEDMENFKNEEERTLFELIAVNNLTYKKAGKYLGISEGKVRYRYEVIQQKLLKYFNKKGINSLEDLL
ncbi:MAG: sigma-70 family RNA polymerase sigma factor [bacterium]|nr:sigma-70 family RNA polymerase sigma factor [bacterium]